MGNGRPPGRGILPGGGIIPGGGGGSIPGGGMVGACGTCDDPALYAAAEKARQQTADQMQTSPFNL